MRIPSLLLAALCGLLLTPGCGPAEAPSEELSSTSDLDSGPLTTRRPANRPCTDSFDDTGTLCDSNTGLRERQRLVIGDLATWSPTWEQMWSGRAPVPELPAVDFDHEVVLLMAMGERNSGGYAIEVRDVAERADGLEVTVAEMSPHHSTCVVTDALTQPVVALRIPRPQGPVRFIEARETYRCD